MRVGDVEHPNTTQAQAGYKLAKDLLATTNRDVLQHYVGVHEIVRVGYARERIIPQ